MDQSLKKDCENVKEKLSEPSTNNTSTATKVEDAGFTGKLAFAIAASAIGASFQHGYNTGVVNNPEEIMNNWINGTIQNRTGEVVEKATITFVWSLAVSIFAVGGMIGGLSTGIVAERFGRKGGLLYNNIFVVLATICFLIAKSVKSYEVFILARLFIGINSGLNAGLSPMYLAEISPTNLRGAIGTVYQLVITISILISQIVSIDEILGTVDLWPILYALTAVPAIFQLVTLPFCPESPKYLLVTKGDEMAAQQSLSWLRGTLAVQEEMDVLRAENESNKMLSKVTFREMVTSSALRMPLIIALTVMVAQQFSGINAVIFYSTSIFKSAGLKGTNAMYATIGTGVINVLMTVVSMFLVERAGRKTLLLIGFGGMAIDTILLTIGITYANASNAVSILCVIFVLIYIVMFATGPGSIPWFLVTELFNQSARPLATSLAVGINWGANVIVGLTFLPIMDKIGTSVFIIFIILQVLFTFFIYKKVPETKNKSIEEITAMFRQQSYQ